MIRKKERPLASRLDRGPLRTMFVTTSMPVGGAETLLLNLIRRFDRERIVPELCCLKELGPLGEVAAGEIPTYSGLIEGKYDWRVLRRMRRLMDERRIDAVITVGAGDKMFWGRLAAWQEAVPVVLAGLHATGWPDTIGRLNRMLTPITDRFIAVADQHGRHLVDHERFPEGKVRVIRNGIDACRFRSLPDSGIAIRQRLGIPQNAPLCGIVAALRPEKNHLLFLRAAALASKQASDAHFVLVGEGPERQKLERAVVNTSLAGRVHMLGSRNDIPQLLSALDVFSLTSHNEANPVSILEAMACEVPVVATRVGSVAESVAHESTGFLVEPGDADGLAKHWLQLFADKALARKLGATAREKVIAQGSLEEMVEGYTELITEIYDSKCPPGSLSESTAITAKKVTA